MTNVPHCFPLISLGSNCPVLTPSTGWPLPPLSPTVSGSGPDRSRKGQGPGWPGGQGSTETNLAVREAVQGVRRYTSTLLEKSQAWPAAQATRASEKTGKSTCCSGITGARKGERGLQTQHAGKFGVYELTVAKKHLHRRVYPTWRTHNTSDTTRVGFSLTHQLSTSLDTKWVSYNSLNFWQTAWGHRQNPQVQSNKTGPAPGASCTSQLRPGLETDWLWIWRLLDSLLSFDNSPG